MNKSGGYVKCKKSRQPKNNQNYSDRRKHVGYLLASEISYLEGEGLCHCEHFRIFIYIQSQVDEGNSGAVAPNSETGSVLRRQHLGQIQPRRSGITGRL